MSPELLTNINEMKRVSLSNKFHNTENVLFNVILSKYYLNIKMIGLQSIEY